MDEMLKKVLEEAGLAGSYGRGASRSWRSAGAFLLGLPPPPRPPAGAAAVGARSSKETPWAPAKRRCLRTSPG